MGKTVTTYLIDENPKGNQYENHGSVLVIIS